MRAVLRFISPASPVHRRCWGQLGLSLPEHSGGKDGVRSIGSLALDLPEALPEKERVSRPYLKELGSYISLADPFTYRETVDCHWIPEPGIEPTVNLSAFHTVPETLLLPDPSLDSDSASRNTSVIWTGNQGTELGRSQLHHAESLLLKGRSVFCPENVRPDPNGGLRVSAAKFRDNGGDAIHPHTEISWTTPDPLDDAARTVTGSGGADHGYLWADFADPAEVRVKSTLTERADDSYRRTPCPAHEYEWPAKTRPLLLCPSAGMLDKPQDFQAALDALLAAGADWGTDSPTFLPGLTYALTRSLEVDLPSSGFFGKILAFRTTGALAGFAKAVVWFIEPLGTGRTLSNAVHELFKEEGHLRTLAGRMDEILRQGWEKSPPRERARFWLPHKLRGSITLMERQLVAELSGGGSDGSEP